MRERLKYLLKFIIAAFMFFEFSKIIGLGLYAIGLDPNLFGLKDYGYYDCLVELIYTATVIILYYKVFIKDFENLKANFKYYRNEILKMFALFMAVKVASALLTSILGFVMGTTIGESENQSAIMDVFGAAPVMMFISAVILAPIVEEGIFRLGLRKVIHNKYLFIVVSGLVFGFMHIFPTDLSMSIALTYSIVYVTMGVFLAYVYIETDNIWVTITLHMINNLISMLAIMFMS